MSHVDIHQAGSRRLAHVGWLKLNRPHDLTAILMHARLAGCSGIILDAADISPEFFRLDSGFAKEVLQTLINFQVAMAVFGDYARYTEHNDAVRDFIAQANKTLHVRFAPTLEEALKGL